MTQVIDTRDSDLHSQSYDTTLMFFLRSPLDTLGWSLFVIRRTSCIYKIATRPDDQIIVSVKSNFAILFLHEGHVKAITEYLFSQHKGC